MTVSLSHNDIRIRFFNAQVNAVSETAAFNVDPNFISATNFGLRTGSHLIDQGDPNPSGGSIALDLAGKLRQERVVDIGAYEWQDQDNIFDSGFEL